MRFHAMILFVITILPISLSCNAQEKASEGLVNLYNEPGTYEFIGEPIQGLPPGLVRKPLHVKTVETKKGLFTSMTLFKELRAFHMTSLPPGQVPESLCHEEGVMKKEWCVITPTKATITQDHKVVAGKTQYDRYFVDLVCHNGSVYLITRGGVYRISEGGEVVKEPIEGIQQDLNKYGGIRFGFDGHYTVHAKESSDKFGVNPLTAILLFKKGKWRIKPVEESAHMRIMPEEWRRDADGNYTFFGKKIIKRDEFELVRLPVHLLEKPITAPVP